MNLFVYFGQYQKEDPAPYGMDRAVFEKEKKRLCRRNVCGWQYAKSLQEAASGKEPESKAPWYMEWTDFPIFWFIYGALYLGIFVCWIEPVLNGMELETAMPAGPAWFLQCLSVYLVFKALIWILAEDWKGIRRWTGLGVLFGVYLGLLYIFNQIPVLFYAPVWAVSVLLGGLAWGCYIWNVKKLQ